MKNIFFKVNQIFFRIAFIFIMLSECENKRIKPLKATVEWVCIYIKTHLFKHVALFYKDCSFYLIHDQPFFFFSIFHTLYIKLHFIPSAIFFTEVDLKGTTSIKCHLSRTVILNQDQYSGNTADKPHNVIFSLLIKLIMVLSLPLPP